jgi:hypothetical protein
LDLALDYGGFHSTVLVYFRDWLEEKTKIIGMIKIPLSIDRSHTHRKTLSPTPSIVNIYSIDMTKYQEGFPAESLVMPDPKTLRLLPFPGFCGYRVDASNRASPQAQKEAPPLRESRKSMTVMLENRACSYA